MKTEMSCVDRVVRDCVGQSAVGVPRARGWLE